MGRGWVELAHAGQTEPVPMVGADWPVGPTIRILSQDPGTGAVTGVVRVPAGYRRPAGHHASGVDFFVLDGALRIGDAVRQSGYYEYQPPGCTQESWTADQDCELLFMSQAAPDWVPSTGTGDPTYRVQVDSTVMDWTEQRIVPGPPAGLARKVLRGADALGERVSLCGNVPRWDYPKLEFHDCVEEIYCISGDLWLGNCGTMYGGSYLWRPEYITHGPFYSHEGSLILVKVPSRLINHFTEDPRATPEENRAQAEREYAEGVYERPT
jgi:hypothetical protein